MKHILIVEDEFRLADFLAKKLQENEFMVFVARNGDEAVHAISSHSFDLVILDLNLPDKDGLEVMAEFRRMGQQMPIIVLTARDEVKDKLTTLASGADDYMTKPFSVQELLTLVRLRLQGNRVSEGPPAMRLETGRIILDLRTRKARISDRIVQLSNQEFILLETFMCHPNEVLSRNQILDLVWGMNYDLTCRIVDVYVEHLHQKLGEDLIEPVSDLGYRFVAS
jgi:DNA-binding response OmpR family regulator